MRWKIAAGIAIIFFISQCDKRYVGLASWTRHYEKNLSREYLDAPFHSFYDGLWNIDGKGRTTVSLIGKKPFTYMAVKEDTFLLPHISQQSLEPLRHIDGSTIIWSTDIFNSENVTRLFHLIWNPQHRFLMHVQDESLDYIGTARLIEAQLDQDPELEQIVQVEQGWYHTYLFYESYGNLWLLAGQVSIPNNSPIDDPDLTLIGFAGLEMYYHGTGMGVVDHIYYCVEQGQLKEAFTINIQCGHSMFDRTREFWITMTSEAKPFLVTRSEISVEHEITIGAYPLSEEGVENTILKTIVSYKLVRSNSGNYLPDKSLPGFNANCCAEGCDSTYFFPEVYASEELRKLKESGTRKQKNMLKDYKYDSTLVYR